MATTPEALDLKALAETYDPDSRDTFLSLYADLSDRFHEKALQERAMQIRAALGDEEKVAAFDAAFDAALEALAEARREEGAQGAAVFASPEHDFLDAHALQAPIPTRLVLDSSPYIRPLARFLDAHPSFVLLLMDGERAALYLVAAAEAQRVSGRELDLLGRHKKGGMSQARYQRHRKGVVERYYEELVTRVEELFREGEADRLLVAGPGQAKRELVSHLSPDLGEALVGVVDADLDETHEDDLIRRFARATRAHGEDGGDAVEAIRADLMRGDLAATGPFEVARAARDGRVELLAIRAGTQAGARKCEEHQTLFEADARCSCGNEGTEVDLIEEAVEYATRSDSRIEFVDEENAFLEGTGGVAATLRW